MTSSQERGKRCQLSGSCSCCPELPGGKCRSVGGRENDKQPRKGEEVSGSAGLGHWLLLGSAHSLSHTASTVVSTLYTYSVIVPLDCILWLSPAATRNHCYK